MIDPYKSVKLIDFGYSEILPRDKPSEIKLCGTPYYIPPEFIKGLPFNGNV